jgi:hypothetical protein
VNKGPADLSGIRLTELKARRSKVEAGMLGRPWRPGGSLAAFAAGLPRVLAAEDLKAAAGAMAGARRAGRPVILAMGAHVIKVGLSPLLIDALEEGLVTGLVMNGAGMIHDVEMALIGQTSEDVAQALADGSFGMARQTGEFISGAVAGAGPEAGLGAAVGAELLRAAPPRLELSLLAAAARLGAPATVHVALGADIIHTHPGFDPAAQGRASHHDFRLLVGQVAELAGGVYLNVGSAVVLPEVFLKALSAARNLGHAVSGFTTVNLDMIRHYRPQTNVVERPVLTGGRGIHLTGHHEINLPLLLALAKEELAGG